MMFSNELTEGNHPRDQRAEDFSPVTSSLGRKEGLKVELIIAGQWCGPSCLWSEVSTRTQKNRFWQLLDWEDQAVPGGRGRGGRTLPTPCPVCLFYRTVRAYPLYQPSSQVIVRKVFPWALWDTPENYLVVTGTPIYRWGLATRSEVGAAYRLQVKSVQPELSYRPHSGCSRANG